MEKYAYTPAEGACNVWIRQADSQ